MATEPRALLKGLLSTGKWKWKGELARDTVTGCFTAKPHSSVSYISVSIQCAFTVVAENMAEKAGENKRERRGVPEKEKGRREGLAIFLSMMVPSAYICSTHSPLMADAESLL